jgi:acetolactate synthase I/II/III large subunit
MQKLNGAQILSECLLREGVDTLFGMPGGAVIPLYNVLRDYPFKHVLCRHEQGAAHMADGYARATGKVGVCIGTSGPGATNMVTGIATAMMDSVPMVVLTGQVPTYMIGKDAFQETDTTGITMPITKHNYLVMDVKDLARVVREAFHIARTGRPGPVLIDIPKDVTTNVCDFEYPEKLTLPGFRPKTQGHINPVRRAARLLEEARRPLILAGHGIILSGAYDELRALAEKTRIPVISTLLGISGFPETHPLYYGWPGMHGMYYCNMAISNCDTILAVGMRMDDRVTGRLNAFAPHAQIIHVDIDPAELGKNVPTAVKIVGDAKGVLKALAKEVSENPEGPEDRLASWWETLHQWRVEHPSLALPDRPEKMSSPWIVRQMYHVTEGKAVLVTDVGQAQMWAAQHYFFSRPNTHITSGGLGPMGYALPAAIGVQYGRPDEAVWCITGDGGFQMTLEELAVVREENLPLKIALFNNNYLGMVRQWQHLFFEQRYMAVKMWNPDYVKLGEAYGIPTVRAAALDEVVPALEWAHGVEGPAMIEFVVDPYENVWPMVPPGASLQETIEGVEDVAPITAKTAAAGGGSSGGV